MLQHFTDQQAIIGGFRSRHRSLITDYELELSITTAKLFSEGLGPFDRTWINVKGSPATAQLVSEVDR